MSFKSHVLRALFSLSVIVSVFGAALADTIRLKDGSTVKGKIVSFAGGKFTIATGSGTRKRQMTFTADEIESIDFEAPAVSHVAAIPASIPRVNIPAQKEPPPQTVDEEVTVPEPTPQKAAPAPTSNRNASFAKPVALSVKVMADNTANGWTNSGWVVRKGQKIRISGTGEVSLGGGKKTGPSGLYDVEDTQKLLKSVPTGALIAVIGDDNNEFIYIGSEREFTATRDGALFLGLNEGNLNDNAGVFDVKVEISPEGGE